MAKQEQALKELGAIDHQKRLVSARLRELDDEMNKVVSAEKDLFNTACRSEQEFLLTNEIDALYHSVSSRPDKRGTVEPRLKELYKERSRVQQSRFDPEQCEGGKREWAPPPDEFDTESR